MKLLSVALARSVWVAYLSDLNPKGKNLYPLILSLLLDKYKFRKYPKLEEDIDEQAGVVFDNGEFKNANGDPIYIKFTIYNFGIMAESKSSTIDTDFFLETLSEQLKEILEIQDYDSIIRGRDYLSQLYVTTEKSLESINPATRILSEFLEKNLSFAVNTKYQLGGLSLWPDPSKSASPFKFTFERQEGASFAQKRYFSSVPLQTDKHIEMLNKLEEILS